MNQKSLIIAISSIIATLIPLLGLFSPIAAISAIIFAFKEKKVTKGKTYIASIILSVIAILLTLIIAVPITLWFTDAFLMKIISGFLKQ